MHVPVGEKVESQVQTKNKENMIDPPDIRNEVFAGTKLSSATSVAGLRDV